jgi:hypothetical protein
MFEAFADHIRKNWDWEKPLLVKWQDGKMKSQGQLSLVHVWFRALADHVNRHQPGYDFTEEDLKTELKRQYGIRITRPSPVTWVETTYLKSLRDYTKGEMHDFMGKVDRYASSIGCLLPVHGEYEELARRQVA